MTNYVYIFNFTVDVSSTLNRVIKDKKVTEIRDEYILFIEVYPLCYYARLPVDRAPLL